MASITDALRVLKTDAAKTRREIALLRQTRVLPQRGAPGPQGEHGTSPDPDKILEQLTARIPAPVPGEPGLPGKPGLPGVSVTGEQGKPGLPGRPSKDGKPGKPGLPGVSVTGKQGKQGRDGKPGASLTGVKLEGGQLAVWIDGVKSIVGKITIPLGPFTPGSGGGGSARRKPGEFSKQNFDDDGEIASTTTLAISRGNNALLMPEGHVGILEIASVTGEITLDGGTNTIQNGNTVAESANRRFNLDGGVWVEL